MTMRFPDFTVGLGHRHRSVTVFPLFLTTPPAAVDYDLAHDVITRGGALVEEVNERGDVGRLRVVNNGPKALLFLEGEHLLGAKQNRIVNTTSLIPPRSKVSLPVSCVERGRWHDAGAHRFDPSACMAPAGLRRVVKASVTHSVVTNAGFVANQRGVWDCIAQGEARLGARSPTQALQDLFATHQQRLSGYTGTLGYVERACGVAMGIGPQVVSIDFFDRPTTCKRFWSRLLAGTALEALQEHDQLGSVDTREVHRAVADACRSRWIRTPAVGLGDEYRSRDTEQVAASALAVGGTFIHLSIAQGR